MKKIFSIIFSILIISLIIYYYLNIEKKEKELLINANEDYKIIAFTFDDGPSNYSLDIANVLKEYRCSATFFEIGYKMKENQDIVKKLIELGMEVGSHSYSHKLLTKLKIEEIQNELYSTKIVFNEITNKEIKLTRYPYGQVNSKISKYALTPIIGWSIDTKDWLYKSVDYTVNEIITNAKDGDIILMHDVYYETLEAVKVILPLLKEKGFIITSVSELFKLKNKQLIIGEIYNNIYN